MGMQKYGDKQETITAANLSKGSARRMRGTGCMHKFSGEPQHPLIRPAAFFIHFWVNLSLCYMLFSSQLAVQATFSHEKKNMGEKERIKQAGGCWLPLMQHIHLHMERENRKQTYG